MRAFLLLVAASLLVPPAAAQSVKAGVEAWQRRDYPAAVAVWRPLAEAGNADAAFNLGQAYRLGRGVPLNLAAAQAWLERAARKGHLDAQTTLGLLLFDNGDRAGGLRWLRQAADKGEPRAQLIYGTALFNGDGVRRDPVSAYALVSHAAAQGLGAAKATLEDMDRLIPLPQRQKGVQIALAKARKPEVRARPAAALKAAPIPPSAAASGKWRIQLGAFSKRASADALFAKLAAGPLAGKQPHLIAAGAVTRLQAGPYPTRAAAAAACKTLSARGQACFPVAP